MKKSLITLFAVLTVVALTACGTKEEPKEPDTVATEAVTTGNAENGSETTAAPKEAIITYTMRNTFNEEETHTVNITKEPLLPYGFVRFTDAIDYKLPNAENYGYDYTYLYRDMKELLGMPDHVEILYCRSDAQDPEASIIAEYAYYPSRGMDQKLPDGTRVSESDLACVFDGYYDSQYDYVQLSVDSYWTGEEGREIHLHVEYESNDGWIAYIENDTEENIWAEKTSAYAGNSIYEFTYMGEVINLATDPTYWNGCPLYLDYYEYNYCGVTQDDGVDALAAKMIENLGEPATHTDYEAIWELDGGLRIYLDMANLIIENNRY